MIAADPSALLEHVFATWSSRPAAIDPEHRDAYVRALTPPAIAAICADYPASFHLDRRHDADDRAAGRRITAPLPVAIGADESQLADAPAVWQAWAENLTVAQVPGGHFIPEEASSQLAEVLGDFLRADVLP